MHKLGSHLIVVLDVILDATSNGQLLQTFFHKRCKHVFFLFCGLFHVSSRQLWF